MKTLLTQLSPAETLFLLHGRDLPFHPALKFTLFDLLLRDVLSVREADGQAYVKEGARLLTHPAKPHELPMLELFRKSRGINIHIRKLIKIMKQRGKWDFRRRIQRCDALQAYIGRGFWGRTWVNDEGIRAGGRVQEELKLLAGEYAGSQTSAEMMDLVGRFYGNIFLCEGIDLAVLSRVLQYYPAEKAKAKEYANSSDGSYVFVGGCGSNWDFDHHSDSIDTSDGGHGCSGDSGSGCSSSCGGGCGGD